MPVRQNKSGHKEQQKTEKHRKKWIGKRNLEIDSRDSRAGDEPI